MIQETFDYFRLHMPSGRLFEAKIPSLLSAEDHDWLMQLIWLLRYEPLPAEHQEVTPGDND